jgi:hypothetical protein
MKKLNVCMTLAIAVIALLVMSVVPNIASAKDFVLTAEIQDVTVQADKNGNEYVRMIVLEPKTLNGVSYNAETVANAFGAEKVLAAQEYKPGDTVKAVAKASEFQGRTYYTILQFIN